MKRNLPRNLKNLMMRKNPIQKAMNLKEQSMLSRRRFTRLLTVMVMANSLLKMSKQALLKSVNLSRRALKTSRRVLSLLRKKHTSSWTKTAMEN